MDKADILELMDKLDSSSLAELSIKEGEFELTLKKAGAEAAHILAGAPAAGGAAPVQAGVPTASSPSEQTVEEKGRGSESSDYEIISAPIVGTFYRTPSPDSPPYVEEGAEVAEGDTLGIIEAMKMMNELEAEFPCRVRKILVENQQMVEYGTPLFEVERLS